AKEGASVVVADIDAKAARETVAMLERRGGQALAAVGDVSKEADVKRMIAAGVKRFRGLHVLYNNAGVLWKDKDKSVLDTKEADWDRVQAINLKGPFLVMKHGIPHLIRSRGGSIINLGSVPALWLRPDREGMFAKLRAERPVSFHEERDFPGVPKGPGFWAVTRYADVVRASMDAESFVSGHGVSIPDQTPELNEFFGSMINM